MNTTPDRDQVHRIKHLRKIGWTLDGIAKHLGLSADVVRSVCEGRKLETTK